MIGGLLNLIKGSPAESSLILVAFSVFIAILLHNRKVNLEGIASVGKLQNENMEAILKQNRALAQDLSVIRKQFAESYEHIDRLYDQIRSMRQHIMRLEALIVYYQSSHKEGDEPPPDLAIIQTIPYKYDDQKE